MKNIITVFLYIYVILVLCTRSALTTCGNEEQIDDLKTAVMIHESTYTVLVTLSAIPITGGALALAQFMTSATFALHFRDVFHEMQNSLDNNHKDFKECMDILDKAITATTVIKSTSAGLSFAAMIPGLGLALVPPRLASSISAMLLIRDGLASWQKNGCQYATTRDCKL